jgi:hypothetical protein
MHGPLQSRIEEARKIEGRLSTGRDVFVQETKLSRVCKVLFDKPPQNLPPLLVATNARRSAGCRGSLNRRTASCSLSWARSSIAATEFNSRIHEGPLPKGGEGMRVSASERWGSLTHKTAGLFGQREETPLQPPAPYSRGARKCVPHLFSSRGGSPCKAGDSASEPQGYDLGWTTRPLTTPCQTAGMAPGPREIFRTLHGGVMPAVSPWLHGSQCKKSRAELQ